MCPFLFFSSVICKRKWLSQEGFLEALLAWSKDPTGCSSVLCLLNATALNKTGVSASRVTAHFVTGQTPEESSRNKLCPPPRRALLPPDMHVPFKGGTAGWHRRAASLVLQRGELPGHSERLDFLFWKWDTTFEISRCRRPAALPRGVLCWDESREMERWTSLAARLQGWPVSLEQRVYEVPAGVVRMTRGGSTGRTQEQPQNHG